MKGKRLYAVNFLWRQAQVIDLETGELMDGDRWVMVPEQRYTGVAERQYSPDDIYSLVPLEARSVATHNHYFAALHNGFQNLPEDLAANFPNEEYLRAWLLIQTGWCEDDLWHLPTEKEARAKAEKTRSREPFARMKVFESTDDDGKPCWSLLIRRAMSQSAKSMGKDEFQKSKKDVLEYLDVLIGTKPGTLAKEGANNG